MLKTYRNTLKFVSETNVTYSNDYKNESYSGAYSVSGSTVTIYAEGVYYTKIFYFDGKLVAGDIYTKG